MEEGELWLGSAKSFDLLSRVVNVFNGVGVLHSGGDRQEPNNTVDEGVNALLGHVEQSVLHNEFLLHQESSQVRLVVLSSGRNLQVEAGKLVTRLLKLAFNDLLQLVKPSFL